MRRKSNTIESLKNLHNIRLRWALIHLDQVSLDKDYIYNKYERKSL